MKIDPPQEPSIICESPCCHEQQDLELSVDKDTSSWYCNQCAFELAIGDAECADDFWHYLSDHVECDKARIELRVI